VLARAAANGTARAFAGYQHARDELSVAFAELTDEVASLTWDNHRIKALHKAMSREMNRELDAMRALCDETSGTALPQKAASAG
jgi:hypothetical protein